MPVCRRPATTRARVQSAHRVRIIVRVHAHREASRSPKIAARAEAHRVRSKHIVSRRTDVTTLLLLILVIAAALGGYAAGRRAPRETIAPTPVVEGPHVDPEQVPRDVERVEDAMGREKSRLIRSFASEAFAASDRAQALEALLAYERDTAIERAEVFRTLADARGETARYRALVRDIENRAPPPILAGVGEPDDLKLIVGVGPAIERMLHGMGIATFRQIAAWTTRDVAEYETRFEDFPGRIERDQWVTQARALHAAKYGVPAPSERS